MKKTLLAIIFALLVISLVACGTKKVDGKDTDDAINDIESGTGTDVIAPDTDVSTDTDGATDTDGVTDTDGAKDTEGTKDTEGAKDTEAETDAEELLSDSIVNAFFKKAKDGMTAEEIANEMVKDGKTEGYVVSVMGDDSYFMGFGNAEITGYSEAARFSPMIGTIPFMAYIFILDEGADSAAFIQTLLDNCNPRWNICTEADTVKAEQSGNAILFLMCQDHPY